MFRRALLSTGLMILSGCGLPLHYGRATGPGQFTAEETRTTCGMVIPQGSTIVDAEAKGSVRVRFAEGGQALGVSLLPGTEAVCYHRRFLWDSSCFVERIEVVAGQPWGGLQLEAGDVVTPVNNPGEVSRLAIQNSRQVGEQSYGPGTNLFFDETGQFRRAETREDQHAANERGKARELENRQGRAQCLSGCAPLAITPRQQCEANCRYQFP
jgi:hypothetical protein